METELCKIFYKYKSDKCSKINHSYSPEYYNHLNPYRETFTNILEVGIGNDKLMKPICGNDYILGIQQLNLYSDNEEVVDVVTGQESEVGEDNLLEAQIERADRVNNPNINQAGQEQPIN